jgi:hypothetical protein
VVSASSGFQANQTMIAKIPASHQSNPDGFALVVTLTLMILLTLIAVGLLSLSAVSLRSSSQAKAGSEARANARLALMIAIGELQKQMGPDQRISANSTITSAGTVPNPHWTGVWDSWIAGDPANAPVKPGYPSGVSHQQTIGNQPDASMRPDYANKNRHFRGWLLSLNPKDPLIEAENPLAPSTTALTGARMPGPYNPAEPNPPVELVAKGSLGTAAAARDYVSARLHSVKSPAVTSPSGRYAWWVGDESQKARVMNDSYQDETLASADKIFRSQAPASTGTSTISGLKDLSAVQQARLKGLPSRPTLDLVPGVQEINDGGTFRASQKGFHSVTPFSRAVLADVREGGLKRDLSTLLERSINPSERSNEFMLYKFDVKDAWANDPSKYPTLPDTPQECVPIQDLAAFYQLYDRSRKGGIEYATDGIQVTTPDYGTPADYTTKFQKEYTTLYRNPVIVKIQFLISLRAEPITGADRAAMYQTYQVNKFVPLTDTHKLRFAVIPAVTMWNPYNVPIVMESGESRARQIVVKAPPLIFDIRKIRADGTILTETMGMNGIVTGVGNRSELIKLNLARTSPVVFQPGEVRVFSAPTGSPYFLAQSQMYHDTQSMNSAKNKVDAAPGWNPNGILTLMNSSGGYQIAKEHDNRPGGLQTMNQLYEPGVAGQSRERWSFTMNPDSTDAFEFTIKPESPTYPAAWPPSEGTSPDGSAFSFYLAQRIFSAQGDGSNKGYSFLNVRHMSLVSRFGGGSGNVGGSARQENINKLPRAFNEQILKQGASVINLGTALEPITARTIAAASNTEAVPFMQLALMAGCETSELANGGNVSGRKFPSRPFLHSSPIQPVVIDKVDGTAPYNHGWNWWIDEMNSILESMVQESKDGNGFYGGGYTAESGATRVVQQEIPVAPPISIAALSHARIGGFTLANEVPVAHGFTGQLMEGLDGYQSPTDDPSSTLGFQRVTATGQGGLFPHVLQAIGNSYANPNLAAGTAFNPTWKRLCDQDDGERNVTFADHSYLANKALWDDCFFSSITPQSGSRIEIFVGADRDAKKVASDFFFNAKPLPNRRVVPYTAGMNPSMLDTLFAAKDTFTNGLADKIAAHLMVEGPFNINSTSVEAWKVLFSSLKGKPIAYLDGGKTPKEATTTDTQVPVGMGTLPTGLPADTADTEDARDPAQWKGLRVISEDEINALAQAMVREVKKRGPFLSLSEFVNRRLDPNNTNGTALKGALQAALDYDGSDNAGPEVTINKNFRSDDRKLDSEVASIDFAFPEAAKGPAAYGSSAYVDQADVLRQFAEQLTPRGDTFVIRTYGDSLDAQGNVAARAWCEAVVQRTPDYVDATDANHVKSADLRSDANKRFGRSFEIVSFRWLNASEI